MSDEKNTDELNLNDAQKQALQELLDALEDNHPDNTQDNKQNTNPSVRLPTSSNNNDSTVSKSTFMSNIQKLPGGSYLHAGLTFFGKVASKFIGFMPQFTVPSTIFGPVGAAVGFGLTIVATVAAAATDYVFGPKALEAPAKDVANTSLDKLNASLPEGVKKIENFDVDSLRAAKKSVEDVKQKKAHVSQNMGERLSPSRQSPSRLSGVKPVIPNPPNSFKVWLIAWKKQIAALCDSAQSRANNLATSAKKHSALEVKNTNDSNPIQPNPKKPI